MHKTIKKILIFGLLLISISICSGCATKKDDTETEKLTEIESGIYIGDQNKKTQYSPKLTLFEDESFEFCVTKLFTYNGQYHIDNNMLILTISEDKSYTFSKNGDDLKLNEKIGEDISKGTKFHLWGSFNAKKTENITPVTSEATTEESSTEEQSIESTK